MLDQAKSPKRGGTDPGACCIDTYRIYDSCRNQECLENLRVLVSSEGQEILNRASAIRIQSASLLRVGIRTEEMPFHKGYFQIGLRYYFHTVLDCCTGLGTGQDVAGLCVWDDSVILYGGEGNVSVFQSEISSGAFCPVSSGTVRESVNLPRVVVEAAEPVALRLNVLSEECGRDFGTCACSPTELPAEIRACFQGDLLLPTGGKACFLSLGLFSIIRIERPAQLVVPACDFCVPEKRCEYDLPYTDPCSLFLSMDFPITEFYPKLRPEEKNCSD